MNKVMTAALIAGGLMLMNAPEAAAHKEVRNVHQPHAYYYAHPRIDVRRPKHMPRWLKRNHAFRHWYKRSTLKRNKHIAWYELYEIYHWERRYGKSYYRDDERYYDRDRRGKQRHKRRHRH